MQPCPQSGPDLYHPAKLYQLGYHFFPRFFPVCDRRRGDLPHSGDYRKRSDFYIKLRRIGLLVSDAFGHLEVPGLEFHHYLAAIAGIDQEQYEAARVDGAGYFQCAVHVTIPALMETYVVLFILQIGNFLNTGYEQYMLFKNALTANNIEVLDLYTYRIGLENMDYSYGVAISILKSLVSISLVVLANMVAKKIRGNTVI